MRDTPDIAKTMRLIEALVFASAAPVAERQISRYLPAGVGIAEVMEKLSARYGSDSGIELLKIGDAWAFRTRAEVAAQLILEKTEQKPLSRAGLETLAIIAYHQPVTRSEIEEIRGVSISRGTMDTLLELGWIKPMGRRRTPGKPLTWGVTESFLDHFGLDSLASLPGLEELKSAGLLRTGQQLNDSASLGQLHFGALSEESDDADEDAELLPLDETFVANEDLDAVLDLDAEVSAVISGDVKPRE